MRIHLKLTQNKEVVPYNYQQLQTGVLHKWLGQNLEHDKVSLYSFSWLKNGKASKEGITFKTGANWFISAYDPYIIKSIIGGIQKDPSTFCGMQVNEVMIQESPLFGTSERFLLASPVFIKRRIENRIKFYYYKDAESDTLLTETLVKKLCIAGLDAEGVSVGFDKSFHSPSIKGTTYNGIKSIGSLCPILINGTPEQIEFAWNVGIGNSTGIGFGALN